MDINNHFKKAAAIFLVSVCFLIGCESDPRVENFNLKLADNNVQGYIADMRANSIEMGVGHGFGVSVLGFEAAPDEDVYGVIEVSESTDLLVARVESISTEDVYLLLKVFVDYEEVAFRPQGEEDYTTAFTFFLESGYQVEIPFELAFKPSADDVTHKLTAGIFLDPQRELINENNYNNISSTNLGMVLNNDLVFGSGSDLSFEKPPYAELIDREEADNFVGLLIAPKFELNEWGFLAQPALTMQVKRGEEIELLFYATAYAAYGYELENYLMIGLLDWQQTDLSGNASLFVHVEENDFEQISDHGMFRLDAIDEVGTYDFIAILIDNPSLPNSLANSFPLTLSNRIVIEVVE
jgi:hypothetical protein